MMQQTLAGHIFLIPGYGAVAEPTPPPTSAFDTFTDVDGTLLKNHIADSGETWTNHVDIPTNEATITGNELYASATSVVAYSSFEPESADYVVVAMQVRKSTLNSTGGVAGRIQTAANRSFYTLRYNGSTDQVTLVKAVNGVGSNLDFSNVAINVDVPFELKLELIGSTINGYLDGNLVVTAVDTDISAAGHPGISFSGTAASASTGVHLLQWEVQV